MLKLAYNYPNQKSSQKVKKNLRRRFGKKFSISPKKQIIIAEKGVLLCIKSNRQKIALFANETKYPIFEKRFDFFKKRPYFSVSNQKERRVIEKFVIVFFTITSLVLLA
jgi:hypothetical protein